MKILSHSLRNADGARQRERAMLLFIARVAEGLPEAGDLDIICSNEARLKGYLSELGLLVLRDNKNLQDLKNRCKKLVTGAPFPPKHRNSTDVIREEWGSEFFLDVGKLKSELPVKIIQVNLDRT